VNRCGRARWCWRRRSACCWRTYGAAAHVHGLAAPGAFAPAEPALVALGEILSAGKNARLYKKLVHELQVAQDVSAYVDLGRAGLHFNVVVTARSGRNLEEIRRLVDRRSRALRQKRPRARAAALQNQAEAQAARNSERVGGRGQGRPAQRYYFFTGNPDYFEEELASYRALCASDVRAVAQQFLGPGRVLISVVPRGHRGLGLAG
jgi:zinc protease